MNKRPALLIMTLSSIFKRKKPYQHLSLIPSVKESKTRIHILLQEPITQTTMISLQRWLKKKKMIQTWSSKSLASGWVKKDLRMPLEESKSLMMMTLSNKFKTNIAKKRREKILKTLLLLEMESHASKIRKSKLRGLEHTTMDKKIIGTKEPIIFCLPISDYFYSLLYAILYALRSYFERNHKIVQRGARLLRSSWAVGLPDSKKTERLLTFDCKVVVFSGKKKEWVKINIILQSLSFS